MKKNIPLQTKDKPKVSKKSPKVAGLASIGEIAPAENHATEILPKTSDARVNCPLDNFLIRTNYSISKRYQNREHYPGKYFCFIPNRIYSDLGTSCPEDPPAGGDEGDGEGVEKVFN